MRTKSGYFQVYDRQPLLPPTFLATAMVDPLRQWTQELDTQQLIWLAAPVAVVFATHYAIKIHRLARHIGNLSGDKTLLGPESVFTGMIPHIPLINRGYDFMYKQGYEIFRAYNSDVISRVGFFPYWSRVFVADAAIAREISSKPIAFPKPMPWYAIASFYGPNVVASEHEEWKMHRRITSSSMSERTHQAMTGDATRIMHELFDLWTTQGDGSRVQVDNVAEMAAEYTFMVTLAAAFGVRLAWGDKQNPPPGYKFSFLDSLRSFMANIFFRLTFSDRTLSLWKHGRDIRDATHDLKRYMVEMIEERRKQDPRERRADLLTALVAAAEKGDSSADDSSGPSFGENELVGNVFVFLFGGYETTAHTIAFALALLAVHPDVQQRLYDSLRTLLAGGEQLTYAKISEWHYGLAVVYETLRIYPPLPTFAKYAAEDSTFVTRSNDGKNTKIPVSIPRGTMIQIDIVATHRNPRYWQEPDQFRPERFLGDYNRDAFLPFGGGPHICMGKRFGEVDAMMFLANFILKYRVEGTPLNKKETVEKMNARLLSWKLRGLTIRPENLPLTFIRR